MIIGVEACEGDEVGKEARISVLFFFSGFYFISLRESFTQE